jgi:Fe2+ or Zn2+ uptake regulation protein
MNKDQQISGRGPVSLAELTVRLRRHDRKITGQRQAILEILRRAAHPMSNKQVLTALPRGECDLATIYRSMHVRKMREWLSGSIWGRRRPVRVSRGGQDGHHHHLICKRCSEVVEIEDCFPAELRSELLNATVREHAHRPGFSESVLAALIELPPAVDRHTCKEDFWGEGCEEQYPQDL